MKRHGHPPLAACTLLLTLALAAGSGDRAEARGTRAGTDITAHASVTYAMQGEQRSGQSNETTVRVDEIVDFVVVWQDAGRVEAFPGETGLALTYLLENTGNGQEMFRLTALSALAGDDFDPENIRLHLDTDGNGRFDRLVDEPYVRGANDPVLDPDVSALVFVVADMPTDALDGALGNAKLVVTSATGVGAPGTVVIDAGDDGTSAVIGNAGGFVERDGAYVVAAVELVLVKSASVTGPDGGSEPVSGAVVTYTIIATAVGAGTARGVVVTDPVPQPTRYIPDSLRLDGVPLTDLADGDAGDFGASTPGTLTVRLGDLDAASPRREVAFQVTIP